MQRLALLPFCLVAGTVLVAQTAPTESRYEYVSPGVEHRVFFAPGDPMFASLAAAGALVHVEDYGSFVFGIVDERRVGGRAMLLGLGLEMHDEQAVVGLNEAPLDTADRDGLAARLASIPPFLRSDDLDTGLRGDALWIVQFVGPIRDSWLARLAATGAVVISPMASNAYVVRGDSGRLADFGRDPAVQWIGAYHPFFRLAPELRALDFASVAPVDVTIQLVAGDDASTLVDELSRFPLLRPIESVLLYVNVRVSIPTNLIPAIASDPNVFGIEPLFPARLHDEAQCQIVAGNLNAGLTGPSAPGYLAWLSSKGFSSAGQFSFIVDVTDSGIDRGSVTDVNDEFRVLGPGGVSRLVYVNNYTSDVLADCGDGHGNLVAAIVAGYNDIATSAHQDPNGYKYGLGVCPFVQLGASKVFNNNAVPEFLATHAVRLAAAYTAGARISSNAWGDTFGTGYTADCQAHDMAVRDATTAAGNQQLTLVFSAGNDGGPNTVHPPGTSKNVITVGAAENNRQTGLDGCGVANTGANNALDIIFFSSRGPCLDQRKKPDIMAPGTHVQGAASRSLNYTATSVCNFAWPLGQTLYTWASGTSFSAPAISGSCALVLQSFLNQGLPAPSPAMIKAILMASTRYMNGVGANDTLWSNNQGMGLVDIGRAFDGSPHVLVDQTHVFGASGQTYVVTGTIASSAVPFRVGLAWTDAPGPTTGNAYVNNLDLQVVVNGSTYKGNAFSGQSSVTVGLADVRNNAEFVFLPAGVSGAFTVTVTATNIAGDGVPGNADTTDQDFALFVYDGTACPPAITGLSPPAITPPLGASVPVTVTGTCFRPDSVVYANGVAMPTTYGSPTSLTCILSSSLPQSQIAGAICMNVQNAVNDVSNTVPLVVGSGNNVGTIRRQPLAPAPGTTYAVVIEGGVPFAPFSLFADLGTITPISGFPDPTSNFILALTPLAGSAGPFIVIFDGLGVFGPPGGWAFDAAGKFVLPGIWLPNPPVGITATLQAAYLDASSPIGIRISWARFPEQL